LTRRYTGDEVDIDYILELSRNPFLVNQTAWEEWEAGEVLFRGASGRCTSGGVPVVVGDDISQFGGFDKVKNVDSTNTFNGSVFVTLEKISGTRNYNIRFYRDPQKTKLVGEVAWASVGGKNQITGDLSGRIPLNKYLFDNDSIIVTFPFSWEITYNFSISPNITDMTVGDVPNITKAGWDYADTFYAEKVDGSGDAERRIQVARYVYVHKIFEKGSLDFLKIDLDDVFDTA
jgi:hypothetical protein